MLLAWLALCLQVMGPKVASRPFYATTEHHLGVTRWEAAPRLGLDAWITKSASGVTVQAIDAMVKADPNLAWIKDAEARGDVDWRAVQEFHDSYSYWSVPELVDR